MSHIFDHLMPSLQSDPERKRQESENRKKCETKLYRLLGEMVETERKYVGDLEQACRDYLPLAGSVDATQIQSLDRREMRKKKSRAKGQINEVAWKKTKSIKHS